jgi:hypothetical protein
MSLTCRCGAHPAHDLASHPADGDPCWPPCHAAGSRRDRGNDRTRDAARKALTKPLFLSVARPLPIKHAEARTAPQPVNGKSREFRSGLRCRFEHRGQLIRGTRLRGELTRPATAVDRSSLGSGNRSASSSTSSHAAPWTTSWKAGSALNARSSPVESSTRLSTPCAVLTADRRHRGLVGRGLRLPDMRQNTSDARRRLVSRLMCYAPSQFTVRRPRRAAPRRAWAHRRRCRA